METQNPQQRDDASALRRRAAVGYTAGPWHAGREMTRDAYYGRIPVYQISGHRWEGLATVHVSGDGALLGDEGASPANAELIADAPTMIELLAALVASWSEDAPDPSAHALRMEDARALVTKHCREAV